MERELHLKGNGLFEAEGDLTRSLQRCGLSGTGGPSLGIDVRHGLGIFADIHGWSVGRGVNLCPLAPGHLACGFGPRALPRGIHVFLPAPARPPVLPFDLQWRFQAQLGTRSAARSGDRLRDRRIGPGEGGAPDRARLSPLRYRDQPAYRLTGGRQGRIAPVASRRWRWSSIRPYPSSSPDEGAGQPGPPGESLRGAATSTISRGATGHRPKAACSITATRSRGRTSRSRNRETGTHTAA